MGFYVRKSVSQKQVSLFHQLFKKDLLAKDLEGLILCINEKMKCMEDCKTKYLWEQGSDTDDLIQGYVENTSKILKNVLITDILFNGFRTNISIDFISLIALKSIFVNDLFN